MIEQRDQETPADYRPAVFTRLAIEGFRGFNRRREFDLDGSVVVLRGPNGVGKTSVFDAMQWLLLGDIPRLKEVRLRQTDEYIVNSYTRADAATVVADLSTAAGGVTISRTGDRRGSVLSWVPREGRPLKGRPAEAALATAFGASEEVGLETTLTAAGLLQQDAARLVLASRPRERFALFSQLLGLGSLESFEAWASRRAKDARSQLEEAAKVESQQQERANLLQQRLLRLRDVANASVA